MKLITGLLTIVGTVLLSISTMQLAQAAFVENDYICELSMAEAIDCGENAIKVEKKRLNKVYMSAYRALSPKQKLQLEKEQRVWLKERNKGCEFKHDGPINNMVVREKVAADVCVANETQKRRKAIVKRFNVK